MKPHLQTTIWTLLKANASQREIERVTGISRHTIRTYQQRFALERANCPGVATGSDAVVAQIAPPRPPASPPASISVATSLCEPHRDFIEAQLRLRRSWASMKSRYGSHREAATDVGAGGQGGGICAAT